MPARPAPRILLLHLAAIGAFLAIPLLLAPGADWRHPLVLTPGRTRELVGYGCTIAYFYLNYYGLVPRLYFRKQYGLFAGVTAACFAAVILVPVLCVPFADAPAAGPRPPGVLRHVEHNLFRFAVVAVLSVLLRVDRRWRETEAARHEAELAALKAQLDPHFLFNSLNTVYALVVGGSDEAAPALARLSTLMRYLLGEARRDAVPLEGEVAHLRDYIALQRLRTGDTAALDVALDDPPPGLQVAPQLLLPLIENAFKHGINPEVPSPVTIGLRFSGRTLHLQVQNRKVARPTAGYGLGLGHTRRRLEGLYPGCYRLQVADTPDRFTVTLDLTL